MRVQKELSGRTRGSEPTSSAEPVRDTETSTPQRKRRLPPMPAWYGSREQATAESMAAKNTLMSRGGARRRGPTNT